MMNAAANQRMISITVTSAAAGQNQPGDWAIEFTNAGGAAITYHAWIAGDQFGRFTDDMSRATTVGSLGSSKSIIERFRHDAFPEPTFPSPLDRQDFCAFLRWSSAAPAVGGPQSFQISTPVQPGNSGGPLFDLSGDVVGVVVEKLNALNVANGPATCPKM